MAENIAVVSKATDNTGQTAIQLVDNAGELSKQADVLKEEVKKFLDQVRAPA